MSTNTLSALLSELGLYPQKYVGDQSAFEDLDDGHGGLLPAWHLTNLPFWSSEELDEPLCYMLCISAARDRPIEAERKRDYSRKPHGEPLDHLQTLTIIGVHTYIGYRNDLRHPVVFYVLLKSHIPPSLPLCSSSLFTSSRFIFAHFFHHIQILTSPKHIL